MIKIENTEVYGFEAAIRGMRNPMNSWDKSDSGFCGNIRCRDCALNGKKCVNVNSDFAVGNNDLTLMEQLAKAGSVHAKYRRMITVTCDITAPLYWWKEFDTYKVGTVRNSCSTMHKIADKAFTYDDFSTEHLVSGTPNCDPLYYSAFETIIEVLNEARHCYLDTGNKAYWWQMIQLLPLSYNQRATVQLNYEVLTRIYRWRKDHKLDEWHTFCDWIESLLYSEIITGGNEDGED